MEIMTISALWLPVAVLMLVVLAGSAALCLPIASLNLYNLTDWIGPTVVEVPIGRIASPGLIDWNNVHLECEGREIPFMIREGEPHWQSTLSAPGGQLDAGNLLVFSCSVPKDAWKRVDVAPGVPTSSTAMIRQNGVIEISYPNLRVEIVEATGILRSITAYDDSVLSGPLQVSFSTIAGIQRSGNWGPFGTDRPQITFNGKQPISISQVRMVSAASNQAMTEANFQFTSGDGLKTGLTYRVHAAGKIEIVSDERPWTGISPWINHCVDCAIAFNGQHQDWNDSANRLPAYSFKDYVGAVRYTRALHTTTHAAIVELGQQAANGRKWDRQLWVTPKSASQSIDTFLQMADEGVIVDVSPVSFDLTGKSVCISAPTEADAPADELLADLTKAGITATRSGGSCGVTVYLETNTGIAQDGFRITQDGAGIHVTGSNLFGLTLATRTIREHLRKSANLLPLVSVSPQITLRGAGFGGGNSEVDFPYGDEAEWVNAFDGMISSGVNEMFSLGMWGNWKLPVTYQYMPELQTPDDPFDPVTGNRLSEVSGYRERGMRLLNYLNKRGVRVWQWLPTGCVISSFADKHPDGMAPGSRTVPCLTSAAYKQYLDAYVRELLETYPIGGVVLIRDDNGGICTCQRCTDYVKASRTKNGMWELYLLLYDTLKANGFAGKISVYPYFEYYDNNLDSILPEDMYVIGHGSGMSVLTRDYRRTGLMPDTWLDNPYLGFRMPSASRMKLYMSDHGTGWIGGAYKGTELQWEALGHFGVEPTSSVSTFYYRCGLRQFGGNCALDYAKTSLQHERMMDILQYPMYPADWLRLGADDQAGHYSKGTTALAAYRAALTQLRANPELSGQDTWLAHMDLFDKYFDYEIHRLRDFGQMAAIIADRSKLESLIGLPSDVRTQVLNLNTEIYHKAGLYDTAAAATPSAMVSLVHSGGQTLPYCEGVTGWWDYLLNDIVKAPMFAGTMDLTVDRPSADSFTLVVGVRNLGVCPWVPNARYRIEFGGDAAQTGLPSTWDYAGDPMLYGDRREITFSGWIPAGKSGVNLSVEFYGPGSKREVIASAGCAVSRADVQGSSRIEGIVTDASSGTRISGAAVSADGASSAITGPDGSYSIPDLAAGKHTILVTHDSYCPAIASVTVEQWSTATSNVSLSTLSQACDIITDGFSRTPGSDLGSTEDPLHYPWQAGTKETAASISDGHLELGPGVNDAGVSLGGGFRPSSFDVTVSVDLRSAEPWHWGGIAYRYDEAGVFQFSERGHGYAVGVQTDGQYWFYGANGFEFGGPLDPMPDWTSPHTLRVQAIGPFHTAWFDGRQLFRKMDSSLSVGGHIGLVRCCGLVSFDDMALRAYRSSTVGIRGRIFDANHPATSIAGARIQLNNGSGADSDADGRYAIANCAPGSYDIAVSADGYYSRRMSNIIVDPLRLSDVVVDCGLGALQPVSDEILDTFTRADSTSLGVTEDSRHLPWLSEGDTAQISNERLLLPSMADHGVSLDQITPADIDLTVTVSTGKSPDSWCGVGYRQAKPGVYGPWGDQTSSDCGYLVWCDAGGTNVGLARLSALATAEIEPALDWSVPHKIRVRAMGIRHEVWIDDVKRIDCIDAGKLTGGYVGLFRSSTDARADDLALSVLAAQPDCVVAGTVRDASDPSRVVEGAEFVWNQQQLCISDSAGAYRFTVPASGSVLRVAVAAPGYLTSALPIDSSEWYSGTTHTIDVSLTPLTGADIVFDTFSRTTLGVTEDSNHLPWVAGADETLATVDQELSLTEMSPLNWCSGVGVGGEFLPADVDAMVSFTRTPGGNPWAGIGYRMAAPGGGFTGPGYIVGIQGDMAWIWSAGMSWHVTTSMPPVDWSKMHTLRVRATGSHHEAWFDDRKVVDIYDSASLGGGYISLLRGAGSARFDNFVAASGGTLRTKDLPSIGAARSLPDGSVVSVVGSVVTAVFPGHFYMEDADRASGIRVVSASSMPEGGTVRVNGVLRTVRGEREIRASDTRLLAPGSADQSESGR